MARSRPDADRPAPGTRGLVRCQARRPEARSKDVDRILLPDPARISTRPRAPSDSAVPSSAASSTIERASSGSPPLERAADRSACSRVGVDDPGPGVHASRLPATASSTRPSSNCTLEIARITSDRGPETSNPCLVGRHSPVEVSPAAPGRCPEPPRRRPSWDWPRPPCLQPSSPPASNSPSSRRPSAPRSALRRVWSSPFRVRQRPLQVTLARTEVPQRRQVGCRVSSSTSIGGASCRLKSSSRWRRVTVDAPLLPEDVRRLQRILCEVVELRLGPIDVVVVAPHQRGQITPPQVQPSRRSSRSRRPGRGRRTRAALSERASRQGRRRSAGRPNPAIVGYRSTSCASAVTFLVPALLLTAAASTAAAPECPRGTGQEPMLQVAVAAEPFPVVREPR